MTHSTLRLLAAALAAFLAMPAVLIGQDRPEPLPPAGDALPRVAEEDGILPPVYARPDERPLELPLDGLPLREPSGCQTDNTAQSPLAGLPANVPMRGGTGMMSGMGMMGGAGGPGASYKALWLPPQPVSGQDANLAMFQEDLSFSVPVWYAGADGATFSAGVRWNVRERVAVDFSSGLAFDRYYFEGRDFSLTAGNRLNVGGAPFLALQGESKF